MKLRVSDLARDHVGLVRVGQCNDDVGIRSAGPLENLRVRGMADDGTNVEPVLQLAEHVGPHVDDSHFIGLFA